MNLMEKVTQKGTVSVARRRDNDIQDSLTLLNLCLFCYVWKEVKLQWIQLLNIKTRIGIMYAIFSFQKYLSSVFVLFPYTYHNPYITSSICFPSVTYTMKTCCFSFQEDINIFWLLSKSVLHWHSSFLCWVKIVKVRTCWSWIYTFIASKRSTEVVAMFLVCEGWGGEFILGLAVIQSLYQSQTAFPPAKATIACSIMSSYVSPIFFFILGLGLGIAHYFFTNVINVVATARQIYGSIHLQS